MTNYMLFCLQKIECLDFRDPIFKRQKMVQVNVPSYIDTNFSGHVADKNEQSLESNLNVGVKLDYRNFGMFTSEIRKREQKYQEKVMREEQEN